MNSFLENVRSYYSSRLRERGPSARGVDWNSESSQTLRFAQLLKVVDPDTPFSINDYGCGYGALADYLLARGSRFEYYGFDISSDMIDSARQLHIKYPSCRFVDSLAELSECDYSVASGLFNVKLDHEIHAWEKYVLETLHTFDSLSKRGFSFNILTSYSDAPLQQSRLYYADPCFYFDYCKRRFARNVALLHDYGLYEFTLIVRKDP